MKKTVANNNSEYENYTQNLNDKWQLLGDDLKNYGQSCVAYSSFQPGMEYFMEEGLGYIAFISFKHFLFAWKERKIVLSNPVCADEDLEELTRRFLAEYENVIFLQFDDKMAAVLEKLGHEINEFGIETELPVQGFSLAGKQRSKLRQWRNKCEKTGVVVKESYLDKTDLDEVEALSTAWVKRKGGDEFSFLTRPFYFVDEMDVRYFEARQDDKLIGFAVFDPIYKNGEIIAYYHNVDRISVDAPNGTGVYVILEAMKVMEEEGVEYLSLGMSPLYKVQDKKYRHNKFTSDALWFAFHKLNFLYPFQGNASHKKKFNGIQKKVYMSSTRGNSLKELLVTMKALNLF